MGQDEQSLVIRSRDHGDRAAFEELVRRTARWLFARIYLQTADTNRTEDLVQETYLRAWRSIASLSDENTFRSWLAAIATTVTIDAARADSRKKRGPGKRESELADVADASPSPPETLERVEQRERVLEMLRELPDEYRDVLTLRYLAGADYETIAKQLAITNGSLRGLLRSGMKMLREKLATDEHR